MGARALRSDKWLSQVQDGSSHIALVAALANLVSVPDYCLPALIRFGPSSESVDSRTEQKKNFFFPFKEGSWSHPTVSKKIGRALS